MKWAISGLRPLRLSFKVRFDSGGHPIIIYASKSGFGLHNDRLIHQCSRIRIKSSRLSNSPGESWSGLLSEKLVKLSEQLSDLLECFEKSWWAMRCSTKLISSSSLSYDPIPADASFVILSRLKAHNFTILSLRKFGWATRCLAECLGFRINHCPRHINDHPVSPIFTNDVDTHQPST